MKKAKYVVIEGTEGVGKTTQVNLLIEFLKEKNKTVLATKEPGTPLNELTMHLRKIMLDSSYDLPRPARELISQSIRSIHMEKVVLPSLGTVDYIIQDRGLLSAFAYGEACGNSLDDLKSIGQFSIGEANGGKMYGLYDKVIVLLGDPKAGLKRAQSAKQEFESGDAMEMKGALFMEKVHNNFLNLAHLIGNVVFIQVEGKTREQVLSEIVSNLD